MATIYMRSLPLIIIFLVPVFFFSTVLSAHAAVVSARVYQENGTTTFIEIKLSKPAPATLIVEMRMPQGSRIIETSPKFSKQNKKNHSVKWLVKNVKTGASTIKIVTQADLDLGSSHVLIRYRDSDDGKLREVEAQK